mmetsp:Transcript_177233/g.568290  ORF Transcript_177233/g.568290 Transcript_177233/m.568290 type:complete len:210 (-) Transcript_177233:147-776(-)
MALLHEMCLLHGILVSRLLQLLGTSQYRTINFMSRMFPPSRPLLFDVFALLLRQLLLPSVRILSRRCGGLVVLGAVVKLGIVSLLVVGLVDTFRILLLAVIARQDGLGIIAKIRRQEHGRQLRDTLRGRCLLLRRRLGRELVGLLHSSAHLLVFFRGVATLLRDHESIRGATVAVVIVVTIGTPILYRNCFLLAVLRTSTGLVAGHLPS